MLRHVRPGRAEFIELARRYSVVPVTVALLADRETPVTAYEKLVGGGTGFLLESVEGGERWARWSFLGWDPAFTLSARDGASSVSGPVEVPPGDPLAVVEALVGRYASPPLPDLPPLHTGAVGYLGYDAVRYIERLPDRPRDDRRLPEMLWLFVGALAAFDRFEQTITLVRNVYIGEDPGAQYDEAVDLLSTYVQRLGVERAYRVAEARAGAFTPPKTLSTLERSEFEEAVRVAKRHIRAGDAYQIVLSQRLEAEFTGEPFSVYRALRVVNPSPFLFYVHHPEVTVIGSSPELMTRVRSGVVYSRPIAGTRPRGADEETDRALAEELLSSPKERAEHIMLVDLARNDLGRVCRFGTVRVDDLMVIERYSHVMHIVSGVSGELSPGVGPVEVLRATFPHGTVSGAPKVRAMQIIDELEPVARGPYGGAVGYLDFSGNMDTAICLRTVVAADGKAWIQAGAGVVADSEPTAEWHETMNKAAAALVAIARAADI